MGRKTKPGNKAEGKNLPFMGMPGELKIKKADGVFINQGPVFQ